MSQTKKQREWYLKNKVRLIVKIKTLREINGRILSEKEKESARKRHYKNRERNIMLHKEWKSQNKQRMKDLAFKSNLKIHFNLTVEQYYTLLKNQNGVCYICEKEDPKHNLSVDHDHKTGEIRGLLCMSCNLKLGWFEKHNTNIFKYLKIC